MNPLPPNTTTSNNPEFSTLQVQTNIGFQRLTFVVTLVLFITAGMYLKTIKPIEKHESELLSQPIETHFTIQEKKPPEKTAPVKKIIEQAKPAELIDLTHAPVIKQKTDEVTEQPKTPDAPVVRRVYGLRRVYSTGIGAGGAAEDAVIGKQGNSLNTPVDTFTATQKELHGALVPLSTVTSLPRLKKTIKPEYSEEMLDAKVQGAIKVVLLVDVDGKVKEVKILNDLGHGTIEKVRIACLQFVFDPAMRGKEPVAVWIAYTIQFVLPEE